MCLIEHRDRLVTNQELLETAWPELVVQENNLSVQVSALRKILGAGTIATVPGRGFRFTAKVTNGASVVESLASPQTLAAAQSTNPAISVLPFGVLSADPTDAFLCDGLAADVTALLARVPGFR